MAGSDSLIRVFRAGAVYRSRPEKHRSQRRDRWNAPRRYVLDRYSGRRGLLAPRRSRRLRAGPQPPPSMALRSSPPVKRPSGFGSLPVWLLCACLFLPARGIRASSFLLRSRGRASVGAWPTTKATLPSNFSRSIGSTLSQPCRSHLRMIAASRRHRQPTSWRRSSPSGLSRIWIVLASSWCRSQRSEPRHLGGVRELTDLLHTLKGST